MSLSQGDRAKQTCLDSAPPRVIYPLSIIRLLDTITQEEDALSMIYLASIMTVHATIADGVASFVDVLCQRSRNDRHRVYLRSVASAGQIIDRRIET